MHAIDKMRYCMRFQETSRVKTSAGRQVKTVIPVQIATRKVAIINLIYSEAQYTRLRAEHDLHVLYPEPTATFLTRTLSCGYWTIE